MDATGPATMYQPNDFLIKVCPVQTVNICGTVYKEPNCNGTLDSGEPVMGGIGCRLYTSGHLICSMRISCPAGTYCFNGLAPGTYIVKVSAPPTTSRPTPYRVRAE